MRAPGVAPDEALAGGPVGHVASLHALRGVAAFLVMALHLQDALPNLWLWQHTRLFANSFLFVDLFFALSGVVLAVVYERGFARGVGLRGYGDFLAARVARVWPMLALASVAALLSRSLAMATGAAEPAQAGLGALFLAEISVMSGWFTWAWLNPPSWSLTAEACLYLLAPFAIALASRMPARTAWLLLAAAPLVPGVLFVLASKPLLSHAGLFVLPWPGLDVAVFGPESPWFWIVKGPFILMRALPMFVAGLCLHRLWRLGRLEALASPAALAAVAAALTLALHASWPRVTVLALMVALIGSALGSRTAGLGLFRARSLGWAGDVSLGVYLLHWPIIELAEALHLPLFGDHLASATGAHGWAALAVTLAAILLASTLAHRSFEIPARRAIRSGLSPRETRGSPREPRGQVERPFWQGYRVAPGAALAACLVFAVLCIPWGMFTQTLLVNHAHARQNPSTSLRPIERDATGRRSAVALELKGFEGVVPVTVRGLDGLHAWLGPDSANSALAEPGVPLVLRLVDLDGDGGTGLLVIHAGGTEARYRMSGGRLHLEAEIKASGTFAPVKGELDSATQGTQRLVATR